MPVHRQVADLPSRWRRTAESFAASGRHGSGSMLSDCARELEKALNQEAECDSDSDVDGQASGDVPV
jgi:transposase-like protein